MATINVTQNASYTGTPGDDIFNDAQDATSIDGVDGTDTVNFDAVLDSASGNSYTLDTDVDGEDDDSDDADVTVDNAEMLNFTNGSIDLTSDEAQYLADVSGESAFSANSVLAYDPESGDVAEATGLQLQTVDGSTISAGNAVRIGDQGTVTLNGSTLNFTPLASYKAGLNIGETETVSFDVTYLDDMGNDDDSDDETITLNYSAEVTGAASNGADRFIGTDENDTIDGLGGNDTLNGNQGDDDLFGSTGDDRIFAGPNDDGKNGEVDASAENDRGAYNDAFAGGAGDDVIGGGAGDDLLTGDDDNRITSNADIDATFDATADGSDSIYGGAGNDEIHTGSWEDIDTDDDVENDTATPSETANGTHTGSADDVAYGGAGDDIVVGANGDDILGGGDGGDRLIGGGGDDTIYGGVDFGDDNINGGNGDDLVFGGAGDDTVNGDGGDDTLFNGAGDDTVDGGAGRDTIWGGEGDDDLSGGGDIDTFGFVAGNGNDTITDFNEAEDLVLASELGFDDFEDLSGNLGTVGGNTVLFYGEDDSITFGTGGTETQLTEDNFIF